jgi:N-acetylglucosaminyl-diphospho-decaprenol L-rhamnosyltransferase
VDLSIIIVNWNSTDYLQLCLASVFTKTQGIEVEVVVVDNASDDGSCRELVASQFPNVVFYGSKINLGFARGSNLGYKLSSGGALLFLNPDTEIHDDVFTVMLRLLRSEANVGAVGVRLLNTDGSLQTSCVQAYPTILNQLLDSQFLRTKLPNSKLWGMRPLFAKSSESARVDAISGACLMVKRNVFEKVVMFDEKYFMYVEDLDLCHKITGAGYHIRFVNDHTVVHHGGKSSAVEGGHVANLRQQRAVMQFFNSTRGGWYSFLYRIGLVAAAIVRLLILAGLAPLRVFARSPTNWKISIRKWSSILRWALGFKVYVGQ